MGKEVKLISQLYYVNSIYKRNPMLKKLFSHISKTNPLLKEEEMTVWSYILCSIDSERKETFSKGFTNRMEKLKRSLLKNFQVKEDKIYHKNNVESIKDFIEFLYLDLFTCVEVSRSVRKNSSKNIMIFEYKLSLSDIMDYNEKKSSLLILFLMCVLDKESFLKNCTHLIQIQKEVFFGAVMPFGIYPKGYEKLFNQPTMFHIDNDVKKAVEETIKSLGL